MLNRTTFSRSAKAPLLTISAVARPSYLGASPLFSGFPHARFYSTETEDDLVVIGGGPGGYVAAIKAAQLGLKVSCVEKRGTLGGTCLNVGCIPSKSLLHTSHMYHQAAHDFAKHGINVENLSLDIDKMQAHKAKSVKGLTGGIEFLFKKYGVKYVKGLGKITGANEVKVALNDGGEETIAAKNIMIATGSDIIDLPFLKVDEKRVISSTGALDLKEVPKKLVVVGGGVIGLEMGSVWSRFGAEVEVIEFMDHIAGQCDGDIAKEFLKILKKQGLKFKLNTKVTDAKVEEDKVTLTHEPVKGGKTETVEADYVLVSVGRRPYTDNLGLEDVGVKLDKRGRVEVDEHLRTNIPSIWAIGDVIDGPMLAHKAEEDGVAVVENIVSGAGHVDWDVVPSVVYTHPEVAWVGKTEEQLKEGGSKYKVSKFPFSANSRARTNDDADGFVKILSDEKTDRLLGAHMIGPNAGELIGELVLAVSYQGSSEDVARTCHAHPTLTEAIKEACMEAAFGKPIHF